MSNRRRLARERLEIYLVHLLLAYPRLILIAGLLLALYAIKVMIVSSAMMVKFKEHGPPPSVIKCPHPRFASAADHHCFPTRWGLSDVCWVASPGELPPESC